MAVLNLYGVFPREQPPCALGNILAASVSIFAAIQIGLEGTNTMNKLNLIAAAIIALGFTGTAASADSSPALKMKPLHGVSFDVGSKRAVGYFQTGNGLCNLTLMVAEAMNGDEVPGDTAARFDVAIGAGTTARLDAAEGKSLEFACTADAQAMSVKALDQFAVNQIPAK